MSNKDRDEVIRNWVELVNASFAEDGLSIRIDAQHEITGE